MLDGKSALAQLVTVIPTENIQECQKARSLVNPVTLKFKKYILPTFQRYTYKWGSENLVV